MPNWTLIKSRKTKSSRNVFEPSITTYLSYVSLSIINMISSLFLNTVPCLKTLNFNHFYCKPGGLNSILKLIRSNFFVQTVVPDIFVITETRFDNTVKNFDLGLYFWDMTSSGKI